MSIDFLIKNTALYRSRAERSAYLATLIKKNFISNKIAAQAMYEFVSGDLLPVTSLNQESLAATRFALNCQDLDIIVDLRKLNGRPKNKLFDPFGAKMAEVAEGRVQPNPNILFRFCRQLYKSCLQLHRDQLLRLTSLGP